MDEVLKNILLDRFPVLAADHYPGAPKTVPWYWLAGHEAQVIKNHGQTLKELAHRGGLAPTEILPIIADMNYWKYWEGHGAADMVGISVRRLLELLPKEAGQKIEWRVEYEIPPLRAIYTGYAIATNAADARALFTSKGPSGAHIRKVERNA